MIFDSNSHYGIGSTIPAAEGYDCSCGVAQMMIESARNDYSMFEAMLSADYTEYNMRNSGYTNEANVGAAIKSAASNIWAKIKSLLEKLVAKIKAIWNSFKSKMATIFASDAQLVKKYEKQITKNADTINSKVQIKWCEVKHGGEYINEWPKASIDSAETLWNEDAETIKDAFASQVVSGSSFSNLKDEFDDYVFGAEHTVTIGEAGGIAKIIDFVKNRKSSFDKLTAKVDNTNKDIANMAKDAGRKADNAKKANKDGDEKTETAADTAKKVYDVCQAYQQVMGRALDCVISAARKDYKQNRAAFAKAITSVNSVKKLESTLLNAVAEAAEDEVDEVIDTAVDTDSAEKIADLTSASLNVLDNDTSADPNVLVYDKVDNYSSDAPMDDNEGEIDVDINAREEAAYFSEMFY